MNYGTTQNYAESLNCNPVDALAEKPLMARMFDYVATTNGRLGDIVDTLERMADELFGAVPTATGCAGKESSPCGSVEALDRQTHDTKALLNHLDSVCYRLRKVTG